MVHRKKTPLLEETTALRHSVGKQGFNLSPISIRSRYAMRPSNEGGHVLPRAVDRRGVQFIVHQHRSHAFVRRNALERYTRRRSKPRRSAVAQLFGPLHVPVNFVLRHAEVVVEYTPLP